MSYTPPAGNSTDFNFTVSTYTPPAGNATNFGFVDELIGSIAMSLTMDGTLLPDGSIRGSIDMSLTMSGSLENSVQSNSMFLIF